VSIVSVTKINEVVRKSILLYQTKEVSRIADKKDKKVFMEPQLIKFDEPLDKVTMNIGTDCYGHQKED
jgi:hypothetical protein